MGQIDCHISCHSASFIVINHQTYDPRASVHHDHSQMADRAKFTLIPTATLSANHAYTLSSQITVILESISRTPLVVIRGTLTAHRYEDGLRRTVLLRFLLQYPDLIFQQDNAKSHTTYVAMNCLTAYQALPWPARSSDPSPIKHAWDMMGRRWHLSGNFDNLTRQLEQIWQDIPQETIRVLFHSMSRRMAACIHAEMGHLLIELITL
ncbi:transposable element Tcb1 transposase [Trichonephila clavipes]|nr:transposable element Tcb1 transposase [Trichonephila clavipes]